MIHGWMHMSEFGAGQRLSGRVLRAMSRRSPQVVGESFRFVHDPGPLDRWLFDQLGEPVVAVYEIDAQPRVGPIHVYDRAIVNGLEADEACKRFFAGNQHRRILGNPVTWPPEVMEKRQRPTAPIEERRAALAFAQEMNKNAPTAPREMFDDDVLWSLNPVLDWFGVRYFTAGKSVYHESLSLMAVPNASWTLGMHDDLELAESFARGQAATQGRELIAWEVMQSTLQLNNAIIFTIERRTRLSDEEYVERYIQ